MRMIYRYTQYEKYIINMTMNKRAKKKSTPAGKTNPGQQKSEGSNDRGAGVCGFLTWAPR